MAFTYSTIPWVSAVQQVADSAGASGDGEMTTRAHNSLRAAVQYFSNRAKWNFARKEGVPAAITGPLSIAITASSGQASASALPGHGILVDDLVVGSGFLYGTRVTATGASGFGINVTTVYGSGLQSFNASFVRDSYDLPADYKSGYSVRLLGSQKALRYIGRRIYDRGVTDEAAAGTPERYDLFNVYGRSKVRLLPPPSAADVLLQRYYRRMTVGSASGDTTTLDIPEDYEAYPISWAKWHFLTDKREQGGQQGTTWLTLATEGLKTMLADQTVIPDEDLGFVPGHAMPDPGGGDRSTRFIDWDT
jgi:hypothetical protein